MGESRLDDNTVDRILAGLVDPVDAPPGYGAAVTLLAVARGLPAPSPGRAGRPAPRTAFGFRPRLPVIAAALVLGGASGAGYAAGLPAAASSTAHHVLRSLGVSSSPRAHTRPSVASTRHRTAGEAEAARVTPAPGNTGNRHGRTRHHAPRNRHGHGAAISALAHSTTGTAGAKGATISAAASGGKSHAGEHGHNGKSGASHGQGDGHGHGQGHGSHGPR